MFALAAAGGGTSNVQRNIIGELLLGFPRDPGASLRPMTDATLRSETLHGLAGGYPLRAAEEREIRLDQDAHALGERQRGELLSVEVLRSAVGVTHLDPIEEGLVLVRCPH